MADTKKLISLELLQKYDELLKAKVAADIQAVADVKADKTTVEGIDSRLGTAESNIEALQKLVVGGEGEGIEAILGDVADLKPRMGTAEGEIDTLQGEMDNAEGRLGAVEGRLNGIVVTSTSVTDGEVVFNKYDDTALAERVKSLEDNPYVLPKDVVRDSEYKHITVTSNSVSDGVNTFEKYVLPGDVVQDSNYASRMSALEGTYDDAKVDELIAAGVKEAKDYADGEIGKEVTRSNKYVDDAIAAEVLRADGKYELAGAETRAKAYVDEVKATILGDNTKLVDTYDTLEEIGNWISTHEGTTVVNLTQAISKEEQARKDADNAIIERVVELEKVDHDHSNKGVLDGTTASFTSELLAKLNGIEEGANKYELPSDVVQDGEYKHITVTENSVSDGVNTFNKYVLPEDVVQDASYVHTDYNYDAAAKAVVDGIAYAEVADIEALFPSAE